MAVIAAIGLTTPDHWNRMYLKRGIGIGLLGTANQQVFYTLVPKLVGATSIRPEEQLRDLALRERVHLIESLGRESPRAISRSVPHASCRVRIYGNVWIMSMISSRW
jgi:hypothetical protein